MNNDVKTISDGETIWQVYVVQIAPRWVPLVARNADPAIACLYVGESQGPPRKRYKQHLSGRSFLEQPGRAAGTAFRKISRARAENGLHKRLVDGEDAWLRRDLMEHLEPVKSKPDSLALELETAEMLRSMGYTVVAPKAKRQPKSRSR